MAQKTMFVAATGAADLTEKVQKHEADGWEFVDLKMTAASSRGDDNLNYYSLLVAVMRREG